jgi:hypothetical protein
MKQSRAVSPTITVLIAMVAFISFGAGYMTRPIQVIGASTRPTPTPVDGDPVGFTIADKLTSLKPSGEPPSCVTSAAACKMTITHSTETASACPTSSKYCALYTGTITIKMKWSDKPPSSHTYTSYSLISSP